MKTTRKRGFGGFANQPWNSSGRYISGAYAFLFSFDKKECYHSKGSNELYRNSGYWPTLGSGHVLRIANECLSNENSSNNESSYNWKNNTYILEGGIQNFKVVDYEVYELTLE